MKQSPSAPSVASISQPSSESAERFAQRPTLVLVDDDRPPSLAEVGLRHHGFAICLYRNAASRPLV